MDASWLRAVALLALFPVVGCGTHASTTSDAATVADTPPDDTSEAVDGADDAPTVDPAYGPCTSTVGCHNLAAVCLNTLTNGYPGGMCTRVCTTQSQCGTDGVCLPFGSGSRCFPSCMLPTDCRAGYNCVLAATGTATPANACLPYCTSNSQCTGVTCNTYSRFCGAVNAALADDGAPCAAAAECKSGRCFTEIDSSGDPTGNLGGLCFSGCTIAADSAYQGSTIPQSDCPTGAVCPQDGTTPAGGAGICRPQCTTATDCRAGYICVHPGIAGTDAGTYTNGYCAAMNCHYMTQMCPGGSSCETTVESDAGVAISGICVTGDGGLETDATVDVVTGDVVTGTGAGLDATGG